MLLWPDLTLHTIPLFGLDLGVIVSVNMYALFTSRAVHFSPITTNHAKFFDYLNSKVEHLVTRSPFVEVSFVRDFSIRHQH